MLFGKNNITTALNHEKTSKTEFKYIHVAGEIV